MALCCCRSARHSGCQSPWRGAQHGSALIGEAQHSRLLVHYGHCLGLCTPGTICKQAAWNHPFRALAILQSNFIQAKGYCTGCKPHVDMLRHPCKGHGLVNICVARTLRGPQACRGNYLACMDSSARHHKGLRNLSVVEILWSSTVYTWHWDQQT